jgi:cytochrome c oxidase subunit 4
MADVTDVTEHETALQHEMGDHPVDPLGEVAHSQHPSAKEYIRIGLILAVLTASEVSLSYWHGLNHAILIPALMTLAFIKFVLVVLWFMHLKFDARTYSRFFVMGIAGAVTLYTIVLMTFRVFLR